MTRPLRIEFPGALYHVTSRGNGGAAIYLDEQDREAFLDVFGGVCQRFQWRCYAYCCMTNHYHVVVETSTGNLSQGMRQVNGVYTQRFNRRHGRSGHVFQGRYKAILVDREPYLLELIRYVVLNPLRAGMVQAPEHWRWSSYQATGGQVTAPAWLSIDWVLQQFGRTHEQAQQQYRQFVHDGATQPSIWAGLHGQVYLGDDHFVAHMQSRILPGSPLDEIPKAQRRPPYTALQAIAHTYRDRRIAMAVAYRSGTYTLKAIADFFGVHYSTVSRAVKHTDQGREPSLPLPNEESCHVLTSPGHNGDPQRSATTAADEL